MNWLIYVLSIALTLLATSLADQPHCVWYGICNSIGGPSSPKYQNCPYNGPAKPLQGNDTRAIELLTKLCPEMVAESSTTGLCCDLNQLEAFYTSMAVPIGILKRCPSCYRNFAQIWCQSTCSAKQSQYIQVTSVKNGTNPYTKAPSQYIDAMDYFIHPHFVNGLFDSCANVQFPGSNTKAIDILCGAGGGSSCTPAKWMQFLGLPQNAPFAINIRFQHSKPFQSRNRTVIPQNATIYPCSRAPDDDSLPCSCQDCTAVCKAVIPYPPIPKSNCNVGLVSCQTFVAGLVFVGGLIAMALIFLLLNCLGDKDVHAKLEKSLHNSSSNVSTNSYNYKTAPQDTLIMEQDISCCDRFGYRLDTLMERAFTKWGVLCTRYPLLVLLFGLTVSIVCSCGLVYVQFTTDPVKLWSSPYSIARSEKDYFDSKFGPFYRTEQLIIKPRNMTSFMAVIPPNYDEQMWGPVFDKKFLHAVLDLQNKLANLEGVDESGHKVGLADICFQPMAPQYKECTIMSVLNYFQNNASLIDFVHLDEYNFTDSNWLTHMRSCLNGPTQVEDTTPAKMNCMGTFGGPVFPFVALGGFGNLNETNKTAVPDYTSAKALVITFVVNNHMNDADNKLAKIWELKLIEYLKNFESPLFTVNFMAERSIQDEITRESESDVFTILISYLFMFAYIAFALGQYEVHSNNLCYLLVQSKVMLGFAGVLIVVLSVTSSIGIYAFAGIPATMIILEVQPFLVLAVGVDNIFIFVQAYQRDKQPKTESLEGRIGRISGEVVPSMLLSSFSEAFCFLLGSLSSMPAVQVFSLYAGLAILFDFFLQVTCFLALFTMDIRRQESGRLEVCCCVKLPPSNGESGGFLHSMFQQCYTPVLLYKYTRVAVVTIFFAWLCSSLAVINKIELGLDQKLSMPEDSYVLRYFESMQEYLSVGPPVYFVVKGKYNYSKNTTQDLICGSAGCYTMSLAGQISNAANSPNNSFIAHPVSSWIDDYFDWMRPDTNCCYLKNVTNPTPSDFCPSNNHTHCNSCPVKFKLSKPQPKDFDDYLRNFLKDNPGTTCAKGGKAAYSHAVHFAEDDENTVDATYFMTYHTILKTSSQYIDAVINARKISQDIEDTINGNLTDGETKVEVFPYSVFYVFYEQYLTLVHDAVLQLLVSVAAIFLVTTLFLGLDPWSAGIITITISLIVVNLMGLMYWWSISFNALSLVNLVMAVGISVEFCSHIVRAFALSILPTRVDRAREALGTMGSSVLSGITLTKFGGIIVLAFSHSQIFQVFYFRMYLGIVLIGALHGLVFLPVFLTFAGPSVNRRKLLEVYHQEKEEGEGAVEELRHSRSVNGGEALLPHVSTSDRPLVYSGPYPTNSYEETT